jgi:hypothetical protein
MALATGKSPEIAARRAIGSVHRSIRANRRRLSRAHR